VDAHDDDTGSLHDANGSFDNPLQSAIDPFRETDLNDFTFNDDDLDSACQMDSDNEPGFS
jgi:hypothetical protein